MKIPTPKVADAKQTPVFPKAIHELRVNPGTVTPGAKPKKRDNIFSKSRDSREDRGERQMKTSQNAQTMHGRK